MVTGILFFLGFFFLIKGAELLVGGATTLAKTLGVSNLVIGLTVVSFGTSAPELVVNVIASFQGNADIALGNIVGSNLSNLLLILGVSALLFPIPVSKRTLLAEIPFSFVAAALLLFVGNFGFSNSPGVGEVSRAEGAVLLVVFAGFMGYAFKTARAGAPEANTDGSAPLAPNLLKIGAGIFGLGLGGKWIVDGGVAFAGSMGVSESLVGLTLIAIGTSLPELATSAVAAYKKNPDVAIGNVVGSNIFNVLWIIGVSAVINPLRFNPLMNPDFYLCLGVTAVLFLLIFSNRNRAISRPAGGTFLVLYAVYLAYVVNRG